MTLYLHYTNMEGQPAQIELGEEPISIGRSRDASIVVPDERASRVHCGVRFEDGGYIVKDLQSKNGTFLNDEPIDTQPLKAGDRIRIASFVITCSTEKVLGPDTALHQVEEQMADGKGYGTILKEIVGDEEKPEAASDVSSSDETATSEKKKIVLKKSTTTSAKTGPKMKRTGTTKKKIKIKIKKKPPADGA